MTLSKEQELPGFLKFPSYILPVGEFGINILLARNKENNMLVKTTKDLETKTYNLPVGTFGTVVLRKKQYNVSVKTPKNSKVDPTNFW